MNVDKNAIHTILAEQGWNFSRFSRELGVCRATVSRIMNGERTPGTKFIGNFKRRFPDKSIDDIFFN